MAQGYVLTNRHGLFPSYEAFIEVVSSMLNQYAEFLSLARDVPWRAPISGLTYVLTSQGWRQHSNGYTHMSPDEFIEAVGEREGAPPAEARTHVQAVMATLRDATTAGEWDDVEHQLDNDHRGSASVTCIHAGSTSGLGSSPRRRP